MEPEWRRLIEAVRIAAKARFLKGEPLRELRALYDEVGPQRILEWLPEAPVLGAPMLVDWLVGQAHQPDPELVARLEARFDADELDVILAGDTGATTGGTATGPNLPVFEGFEYGDEPSDPGEIRRAMVEARERLREAKTSPSTAADVTMESATGGAAR